MAAGTAHDVRDDLPRVSVDTFQDLARIKESLNDAAIAALDAKLAERGLSHHRAAFLQHMQQVPSSFSFLPTFGCSPMSSLRTR
jgi:hypothetical protein